MTDLIGLIGTTVTLAKSLQEISQEYKNSVLVKQISDLNFQLSQVQNEASQLMNELRSLKAEIDEQDKNPLAYDGTVYKDNTNHALCPACYDDRRKRIHLIWHNHNRHYRCPVCDAVFFDR